MSFDRSKVVYSRTGQQHTGRAEKWGGTPEGEGRRICLKRPPRYITIDNIRDHFGRDKVEGVLLGLQFASVQFTRPAEKTFWMMRKETTILGVKLEIEDYRVDYRSPKKSGKPQPASRALARRRSRSRSRSRTRTPDRHRGRSREREDRRSRSPTSRRHGGRRSTSRSSGRGSHLSPSRRDHRNSSSNQRPSRESNSTVKQENAILARTDNRSMTADSGPGQGNLMPYSVELCLKYVLDRGNFGKLSLDQFEDILNFIVSERDRAYPRLAPATNWGAPQASQLNHRNESNYHQAIHSSHQYPPTESTMITHHTPMQQIAPAPQFQQVTPLYNPLAPQQSVIYPAIQHEQNPAQETQHQASQPTPPADERPDETPPDQTPSSDQNESEPAASETKSEQIIALPECLKKTTDLIRKALKH